MPRSSAPTSRIIVAGVGLVSPLGHSAWQTFRALLNGRTLADRAADLPDGIDPVDLVRMLGSTSLARHAPDDPAIELAERAAREAAFEAGLHPGTLDFHLGTSKGAVHALERVAEHQTRDPRPRHALAFALGPHGYLADRVAQRLGSHCIRHHVAACASSLTALHQARMQLLEKAPSGGRPAALLILTAESALTPLFIHSYRRLGVLAPLTTAGYQGRPLDQHRNGFMLAELAAAVVLQRVEHVLPGQIELVDTALASESFDLLRPSPTMPALRHVAEQLCGDRAIDLLHPHAPGTLDHDAVELNVYADAFASTRPRRPPDVYACKGALGHGLGAAGLVSFVLACLCARSDRRPPMPWLQQPIAAGLPISAAPIAYDQPLSHHAVFAAGFAGHVAGAVIRRH